MWSLVWESNPASAIPIRQQDNTYPMRPSKRLRCVELNQGNES